MDLKQYRATKSFTGPRGRRYTTDDPFTGTDAEIQHALTAGNIEEVPQGVQTTQTASGVQRRGSSNLAPSGTQTGAPIEGQQQTVIPPSTPPPEPGSDTQEVAPPDSLAK
jgi:hypothetical protein